MRSTVLFFLLVVLVVSCRKGTYVVEDTYFGKLQVAAINYPGAVDIRLRFNGDTLGTIPHNGYYQDFTLPAGKQGKLSLYDAQTDTLIVDTIITVQKNASVYLRFLNAPALGFNGFLEDVKYSQDSLYYSFINTLSPEIYPNNVDVIIYKLNRDWGYDSTNYSFANLAPGKLSPVQIFPFFENSTDEADGWNLSLYFRLKDVKTGQMIPEDYQPLYPMPGELIINKLENLPAGDPPYGGYPYINPIEITN